jgi:fumarylacetoacetase
MPIGYNGRASTVVVSGTPVRRPLGQIKEPDDAAPRFGPSGKLDFELELGAVVGTPSAPGRPVTTAEAARMIFGYVLLNDWSARDIQAWEYQPLGPFLAKSFASTLAPWVVTLDALAPFRVPAAERAPDDPRPLSHLTDSTDQAEGGFDIGVSVWIETAAMRSRGDAPHLLARARYADTYWTVAQFVAHQTSNGCNVRPGDLLGSGTVSSREPGAAGCLLELTRGGAEPLSLPGGEARTFLEDGDRITLHARAERDGFASIGFGECSALIEAAL